jgi:hypothetical protein
LKRDKEQIVSFMKYKKIYYRMAVILLLISVPLCGGFAADKKRIAVLDFSSNNVDAAYARVARNFFESSLFQSGIFQMLEREKINIIFKEHRINSGFTGKTSHTAKPGKTLAVDYAIVGSLDRVDNYSLSIRIISVREGKIIFIDSEQFVRLNRLSFAADQLSERIISALGEERTVLKRKTPPVKKPDPLYRLLINSSFAYIMPYGSLHEAVDSGYGLTLGIHYRPFVLSGLIISLNTGIYPLKGRDSGGDSYSAVTGTAGLGYNIDLPGRFYLIPGLSGGAAAVFRDKDGLPDQSLYNKRRDAEIEPVSEALMTLGIRIWGRLDLHLRGKWGCFWEHNGLKQYAAAGAGIGVWF